MNPPRILLTGCFEPRGAEFGDAAVSLSNPYARAIVEAGGLPLLLPFAGNADLLPAYLEIADGVLLTGGEDIYPEFYTREVGLASAQRLRPGDLERDRLEIALVRAALDADKALLGICRGHQLLNVALGGTLIVDIETELPGAVSHRDPEQGCGLTHEVTVEPGSLVAELLGTNTVVNSSHHQAVLEPAAGLRATARTADGIVEVMEGDDRGAFLFSVQFHPERHRKQNPAYLEVFRRFVAAAQSTPMNPPINARQPDGREGSHDPAAQRASVSAGTPESRHQSPASGTI